MTFKSSYLKYSKAMLDGEKALREINSFFSNLDLEYSINYCAGDGVLILCHDSSLNAYISEDQVNRLSKSKTKDQALIVIKELNFYI